MISVTFLSSYLYCKRKLFLEQVLKYLEIPKEALIKGRIRHETHELINKAEESLITEIKTIPQIIDLEKHFKIEYLKFLRQSILNHKTELKRFNIHLPNIFARYKPGIEYEAEKRSHTIYEFIKKTTLLGDDLWKEFYPKIKSELRINSTKLHLKGIIDQLEVYPDSYTPIELKTGSAPKEGVWPSHKMQLAAYALLAEEHFNTKIDEGFVDYLDHQRRIHIYINPFLKDDVRDTTKKTIALLNNHLLPKHTENKNKCKSCGLKDICYSTEPEKRLKKI